MIGFLSRHWLLGVLLGCGLILRLLVWLAYQPALLYIDSFRYLSYFEKMPPDGTNPLGYAFWLRWLLERVGLSSVAALQHLVGMAIAVALYALARRHGVPRWLAAAVAAVVLLDGYQLQIEENIMSEIWFQALLVAILWALLGRGEPNWRRAGVAGLLLGAAILTRTIGVTIGVPMAFYLVAAGGAWRTWAGWRRISARGVAAAVGLAVVVVPYANYYRSFTGEWGLTGATSTVMYGRAATIADCPRLPLEGSLRKFCPPEPLGERLGVDHYSHAVYGDSSWPGPLPPGETKEELAREFGRIVLRNQPFDFAVAVLRDFSKNFALVKVTSPGDVVIDRWQFQTEYPRFGNPDAQADNAARRYGGTLPSVNEDVARVLRGYQLSVGYTAGPLLGLAAVAGLLAGVGVGRARRSGVGAAALLATGSGLIVLLGSAAFEFSWRYELPALVLLPLGGAIGLSALLGRASRPSGPRPRLESFPDEHDAAALAAFEADHPGAAMGSLVVLIAAYNEEDGIGAVLREMPTQCGDRPVAVLVVVDGATDRTAEVAAEAVASRSRAYVCGVPQNRGQGAALRLGYHLAAVGGARYVVTTDADGQYDNRQLPRLVAPLVAGHADFVTGSRRLGSEQSDSAMRWLGVRVFAALASVLTRQRLTDTSFGFRAMRVDDACSVTLREPQFQASELLVGMLAMGARVREVPMSMRLRGHGRSKKGGNIAYGLNYARVMVGTWWRAYVWSRVRRTRTGRRGRTSART